MFACVHEGRSPLGHTQESRVDDTSLYRSTSAFIDSSLSQFDEYIIVHILAGVGQRIGKMQFQS